MHTTDEIYFVKSHFEPAAMMGLLEDSIRESAQRGFNCLRTAGDMSWVVECKERDRLLEYEQMVQATFPSKPVTGMCLYPIDRFESDTLARIRNTHNRMLDCREADSQNVSLEIWEAGCKAKIVTDKLGADAAYHFVVEMEDGQLRTGASPDFNQAVTDVEAIINTTIYPARATKA